MAAKNTKYTSKDWFFKVLAALLPGALFTYGLAGVVGLLCHANGSPQSASGQYLMWLAALVWCLLLSFCFLFRTALQAWVVLLGGSAGVWGLFFAVRSFLS